MILIPAAGALEIGHPAKLLETNMPQPQAGGLK
jgi:hypothetical protein